MAIFGYIAILFIVYVLISLYYSKKCREHSPKNSFIPTNWPFLGMLPALIYYYVHNFDHPYEVVTNVLKETGYTFLFIGPWFVGKNMLVTSDPSNVHYVMSRNHSNYPKSRDLIEIFEIFGDGIINSESKLWEMHRKTTMTILSNPTFHKLLEHVTWSKVEKGLLPILENFCNLYIEFDFEDLFERFTFDISSMLFLDLDPQSLTIELPYIPCEKAFNHASEAMMHRGIWPRIFWKLQRWLGLGQEKNLREACIAVDEFFYPCVSRKLEELRKGGPVDETDNISFVAMFLKAFAGTQYDDGDSRKFLRDTFFTLIFAGADTTSTALSWFFWLISKNPEAESRIMIEIKTMLDLDKDEGWRTFSAQESGKLVYLHGGLCEALRLFPPAPFQFHSPTRHDMLPSGHRIDPNTTLVLSYHSMGRMESIWGADCLDFKPERWISEHGTAKNQPSYKFPAFNSGPRSCLGKDMAFIQMKIVAATILYNYHLKVVEKNPVFPSVSIISKMNHGLKVRLSRRKI